MTIAVINAELADIPESAAEAAKFAVSPAIHADDFVFQFLVERQLERQANADRAEALRAVTYYYLSDGRRSAERLSQLVRQYHPDSGSRRLRLLEFASGYGCVTRHLCQFADQFDLVASDIHPKAIQFLRQHTGAAAVLSNSEPAAFDPGGGSST